jgi:hypothetical protein
MEAFFMPKKWSPDARRIEMLNQHFQTRPLATGLDE